MLSLERSIAIVASAFLTSLVAIAYFKRLAARRRWLDSAGTDPLKIHASPIPFVGGFGIALGFLVSFFLVSGQLSRESLGLTIVPLLGIGMFALGFCDDKWTVNPTVRLGFEILAAIVLAIGGFTIPLFRDVALLPMSALVLVYVVGAINALNMQDGLDGLAGGVALISCAGFAVVGVSTGHWLAVTLALALGGGLLAFLIFNFHPASVFMGDNGSYFVGFILATVALLLTSTRPSIWHLIGGILLIGAPVFDAGFAIVRRLRNGVSPFAGDRSHFYDYLSKRGFRVRTVAFISYAAQIGLVGIGVFLLLG